MLGGENHGNRRQGGGSPKFLYRSIVAPRGCYEPAAIVAACFIMMQAKAMTWSPASVWA